MASAQPFAEPDEADREREAREQTEQVDEIHDALP